MSSQRAVVSSVMTNILEGKNAVIYGAGGSIGGAVARTFAREGATVFLAGRTRETLDAVAAGIGARAHVAVLDATDEAAVDAHAVDVGRIDISFNLIRRGDSQGTALVDMDVEDYLHAITTGARTSFLTGRAAARAMSAQGSGVILHLTSASSRGAAPGMGNTGPADAATETFHRYLAAECGPRGVRVVGIHVAGIAETLNARKVSETNPMASADVDAIIAGIAQMSMLKRAPELQPIADTAAFLASDHARTITSGIVNATCGLVAG